MNIDLRMRARYVCSCALMMMKSLANIMIEVHKFESIYWRERESRGDGDGEREWKNHAKI